MLLFLPKKKKKKSHTGSSMCCHQGRILLFSPYCIKLVICTDPGRMKGAVPSHTTWTLPSFRLRPQEPQISSLFLVSKGMVLISHISLIHPLGKLLLPSSLLLSANSTVRPCTSLGYKYSSDISSSAYSFRA